MKTYQEKISKELNVTPEEAWEVIGAVSGVDKWFGSLIKTCNVVDDKRFIKTNDGMTFEEHILEVNNDTRTLRYGIQQEMLPIENIKETMTVKDNGTGKSVIDWSASFDATDKNAVIAKEALRNMWNMGLEEMEQYINN